MGSGGNPRQPGARARKWKGFPAEENTWEPLTHLRNSNELIEEFHKAHPSKPDQEALACMLREAAEKEAARKARADAAREAKELRKRGTEEALAGIPKGRSERLSGKGPAQ
jgi:hypothetical protein